MRAAALWNIWIAQNHEVIPKTRVSIAATRIKIWNKIRVDMQSMEEKIGAC